MESVQRFSVGQLNDLRSAVAARMGERRYTHTLAVEKEIAELGEVFLPDKLSELRAAALLHDTTKELTTEEHLAVIRSHGIPVTEEMLRAPSVLHAMTAAIELPELFPEFNLPYIISAIRKHSTGSEEMSIFEKLLFLSDHIEPTRKWEECRELRRSVHEGLSTLSESDRTAYLDSAVLTALASTVSSLLSERRFIVPDTIAAYNALAFG